MRRFVLATTGLALLLCLVAPPTSALPERHPFLQGADYVVNSTKDPGDGWCDATDCTLHEAIYAANGDGGPSNIAFNIPPSAGGYNASTGVWTIQLMEALPALTEEATGVMGSTQTGSQGDTNPYGPEIAINGASTYDCFRVYSQHNTIEGLVINECVFGVKVFDGAAYNVVSGSYLGISYDGTIPSGNTQAGICIANSHDNSIGGTTTQERNVISGNDFHGVVILGPDSHDNDVIGNYIGTNAQGTGAVPNDWSGVHISDDAHDNTIGSQTSGKRNLISGNGSYGVQMSDSASRNRVAGNYIGTAVDGVDAIPNGVGILMAGGAHQNLIGYENTIAHNTTYGVRVDGGATITNTIAFNSIHSNGLEGIYLSNGGNGGISPPQITTGICTSASGTAPAGYNIQLFSDYEEEGRQFRGSDVADGGGAWTVYLPSGVFSYPNLTATATDAFGNTSEFSDSVPSGCLLGYLPIGMKRY